MSFLSLCKSFSLIHDSNTSTKSNPSSQDHLPMNYTDQVDKKFSALILASGSSERMGRPKALLLWDAGITFLEKLINEYRQAGCVKILCTVNQHIFGDCLSMKVTDEVEFILNEHPEQGRMYSVRLGLAALAHSEYCFIQNVDNPFIHAGTIVQLMKSAVPDAWISPEWKGQSGHPVLLPPFIIWNVLRRQRPDATLQEILKLFTKKVVLMEDDLVLRNINTPEEYRNLRTEHC